MQCGLKKKAKRQGLLKLSLGTTFAPTQGPENSIAQGFNPGNRPPGRRALKGRQIRFIRNNAKLLFMKTRNRSALCIPCSIR
jgi:hypothetical protein